jgi:hypothetical protein
MLLGGRTRAHPAARPGTARREARLCRQLSACAAKPATQPQALRNLVWRDELFPRPAFRRAWDALAERLPVERACRTMVALLDIAYCGGCEAELARHIEDALDAGELPNPTV